MNSNEYRRLWEGFWQLADPKIWIASTIPMAVGGAFAYGYSGKFDMPWFIISLIAVYFIEIGKNAINEFVDYFTGVDRYVSHDKRTPFSGGKKTIVDGKLTVLETMAIAAVTLGIACTLGLYIMFFRDFNVFWIGLAGVALSVFYSLPPFKLVYRGLGELTVGLTFGPLIVSGIYLVMTRSFSMDAVLVSLPVGFLIANILLINEFPDYEADKRGGKGNLVVRLGKERAVKLYGFLYLAAFVSVIVLTGLFKNPFWLLGLAGMPMAGNATGIAKRSYNDIPVLIQANARTVLVYQITGLALVIASITHRLL